MRVYNARNTSLQHLRSPIFPESQNARPSFRLRSSLNDVACIILRHHVVAALFRVVGIIAGPGRVVGVVVIDCEAVGAAVGQLTRDEACQRDSDANDEESSQLARLMGSFGVMHL